MRSLKCCVSPQEECRWVQLRRYVAQLRGPRAARRGCLVSRLQLSARLYRQHVRSCAGPGLLDVAAW